MSESAEFAPWDGSGRSDEDGEAAVLVYPFHADLSLPDRSGRAPVRRTGAKTAAAERPRLNKATRADIRAFIERHDRDPKPFRWTKSADDIPDAVKRFC